MSTADSKALLVEHFPGTAAKDWRREAKYKNFQDEEIRRFRHPVAGVVFIDDEGEIATSDDYIYFCQASKLTAGDFYFSISMCYGQDAPCQAMVSIVHRPFFDSEGFMDSIHLGHVMERLFPKSVSCCEEMESAFSIDEEFTAEELNTLFTTAGFAPSEALDQLVAGVSAPADELPASPSISHNCLDLLSGAFPKADPQYWNVLGNHLNHEGIEVCVLYHYVFGQVWVIETDAEVTQDGWWHKLRDVSKLRPFDYYAWALGDTGGCIQVYFVLKDYFSREGQVEDVELDHLISHIPKSLGRVEFLEGAGVSFLEQTSSKVVMDALLAHGYGYSEAFRKHVESEFTEG